MNVNFFLFSSLSFIFSTQTNRTCNHNYEELTLGRLSCCKLGINNDGIQEVPTTQPPKSYPPFILALNSPLWIESNATLRFCLVEIIIFLFENYFMFLKTRITSLGTHKTLLACWFLFLKTVLCSKKIRRIRKTRKTCLIPSVFLF